MFGSSLCCRSIAASRTSAGQKTAPSERVAVKPKCAKLATTRASPPLRRARARRAGRQRARAAAAARPAAGSATGSGWAAGSGTGIVGTLISRLSAWKMDTTAGPRMTTNRAGKIMKTSGKSILIGAFCACCSAAARRRFRISIARLRRICADRDAEQLALHHRARERLDRRSRAAADHVLERLDRREAHPLLLEHDPQLVAERSLHPLAGELERGAEAESRLDRDDEQVDQLGHAAIDPVQPGLGTPLDDEAGPEPADEGEEDGRR